MRLNDITYKVRGAVFEVYNILGPGLLESAYEAALFFEFVKLGMEYKTQVPINVLYKGQDLGYRLHRYDFTQIPQMMSLTDYTDFTDKDL